MLIFLPALLLFGQSSPDPARLRTTIKHLSSFPTRNTSTPGLARAAEWVAGQFSQIPGLRVQIFTYTIQKGPRVPVTKDVAEVVAILPGETDHRVIIGGHLDSINLKADPMTGIAPGADDDGSGVALTLEAARLMAKRKWHNTVVFVAFSGEEQGTFGSAALAQTAKSEGWKIDAVLSNDIVGSDRNTSGMKNGREVRVFSDDDRITNSRELARLTEFVGRSMPGFRAKLIFRPDRFGRGGDHSSFNQEGFPAVRFTEVEEDFTHQHTQFDLPQYVNYDYLARVTALNVQTAESLASAGVQPSSVKVKRELSHNTTLQWTGGEAPFVVYWRATTSPVWEGSREVGAVHNITLNGMSKDDLVFAVGSKGGVPLEAR